MIDLHAHILPGIDDGSQSLEMSLEMARIALDAGVRQMAATPHCNLPDNPHSNYDSPQFRKRLEQLRQALAQAELPLELFPGAEVFADENLPRLVRDRRLISLNDGPYLLVEFAFEEDVDFVTFILEMLLEEGYTPLVAHPERYGFVVRDPEFAWQLVHMGCCLQLNRGSLMGRFGSRVERTAWALAEHQLAVCVASDCHRSEFRTPYLADVREALEEAFGPECPRLLLEENPGRILAGRPVTGLRPFGFRSRRGF